MLEDVVDLLSFLEAIGVPVPEDLYVKDPCPWGSSYESNEVVTVPLGCGPNTWHSALSTDFPLASMGECCSSQNQCYHKCGIPGIVNHK